MHKLYDRASLALGRVLTISRDDLRREDGQGATEYGLVIAFVVVSIALTIGVLGTAITDFLGRVAGKLNAVVP
jgi:Flp pilus assembly pilin Flp